MNTSQKGRVFISYRRADSAAYAGRITDHLTAHFGEDAIFLDVNSIEAGLDFVKVLENAVQSCDVLIAIIGSQWLDILNQRLGDSEDFVRIEIATALSREIRVIPVLLDDAVMPQSIELPENLKLLSRRNAVQIHHYSFKSDIDRLMQAVESKLGNTKENQKNEKNLQLKIEEVISRIKGRRYEDAYQQCLSLLAQNKDHHLLNLLTGISYFMSIEEIGLEDEDIAIIEKHINTALRRDELRSTA